MNVEERKCSRVKHHWNQFIFMCLKNVTYNGLFSSAIKSLQFSKVYHPFSKILILIFSTCSFTVSAQQYTFIQYSLNEGLAQSQVRCIFQDSRGYIWAGTLGGLSRFDGRQFFNYDRQNGFSHNQINCVIELHNGTIAAGSNGSINFINGIGVKNISLPEMHEEDVVNALYEDEQDRIWIGTDSGLLMYSVVESKFVESPEVCVALSKSHIKTFHSSKNKLFILTKEKIWTLHHNELHTFFEPVLPETNLFDLTETSNGNFWVTSKGEALIQLDHEGKIIRNYSGVANLNSSTLTQIITSENGDLFITSRFGFYKFDGENFKPFTEKEGLPTNDIRDVLQDRDGNIWLATYGSGIQKFTGEIFTSYSTKDGLIGNAVMSIVQDQSGDFWFSTFDKGICKMVNDSIMLYDLKDITSQNRIWSSLGDIEGNLWFSSSDGLFQYSKSSFKNFNVNDSLPSDMVLSLFQDKTGLIWIGTSKGVATFSGGKFSKIIEQNAPTKRVRCIKEDRIGNLWFATNIGVFKYDRKIFTSYSQKDGLPDNSTNCIEVDEYNHIWVGTMGGLAVLNGTQFTTSDIHNTPGSDVINFLKYHNKTLWIGTNNGLHSTTLDAQMAENKLRFKHYGLEDGLRSLETNLNAVYVDNSGDLWFGSTEGVVKVNSEKQTYDKVSKPPLLSLAKIQINLQDRDWTKTSGNTNSITGLSENLKLNYTDNHVTFYFTGISSTYPSDIQYQYILEGLDEEWKPITKNNFATYSNLPFSTFTFLVKAANKEGMWCDPISYTFSITPPFWYRWWFIALEVLTAIGVCTVIIQSRRKAAKEKRDKEWFEVRSKMLALEQQSLNSSMNRHFIFNALNSIQYYINRQDKLAANKYLTDFAKLIRKNLDTSEDNLTSLADEIERLQLYLKLEHMRFKDKFEYKINIDPLLDLNRIKVPAMIVQPFLENSIWHGLLPKDAHGLVQIDILKNNGHVEFVITDNGVGIENSLKNKTGTDSHISKGMEITKSRIDLIKKTTGQTIELRGPYQFVEELTGETGTKVRITLPENFHELFSQ